MDLLPGQKLLSNKTQNLVVFEDVIKNRATIILFFSANWCNTEDCKTVLDTLLRVHKESLKRSSGIEIIFISKDKDEKEFDEYFKKQGQWFAVPFNNVVADQLCTVYGVTNIPSVIVLKKNGEVITKTGREEICEKGINVLVTWT